MKITRPDLAALAFAALVVVAITLLSALHVQVPDVFPTLTLVALSAGAGVAAQSVISSATEVAPPAAAATTPAAAPAQSLAAYPPAVGTATDPAVTGVLRPATHAT